ncbi:transglutaminase N-terminal domain-containing protein [Sphingomonas canadensis]|uniref:Transglutaminase N-terminal domain-containing protein n=1 Tax=Sphingomonas canadensis TaxID=1219257 RepID=A0ABW3H8T3_9SPHN|nr:transglutaminase family protein [Sphingomonas canadensis]MCW3836359.1 transglutaminase family protein [Sphingomonas canadensis]
MRIAVDHRTHYRFSEPQARIVQMLRLTPTDTQDQTVVSWSIGVDCDARLRHGADGFGNAITMLYAEGPIAALDITVIGEVLTMEAAGVIRGSHEPLPPLLFLRTTPATTADAALAAFAAEAAAGEPLDRLHRLNAAFHARFPDVADVRDRGRGAAEAFGCTAPSSREAAQMFLAAARSLGVPARYVSGYRSDGSAHGAPHGWAEAHVAGLGWVGFDPATGLSPDESYVRVAIGLDAAGAAPTAGTRSGSGAEELDVDVIAEPLGREE